MPESPQQIAVRLRYRGHNRPHIDDPDRTPETLVLAAVSDAGTIQPERLSELPWWSTRPRRFRCALDRLWLEEQLRQTAQGFECAESLPPLSAWASRERAAAKPAAPAAPRQKMLF